MLTHLTLLILSLIIIHIIGGILLSGFNNNKEEKNSVLLFAKSLIIGLIFVVSCYSFFITKFVTINVLLIFISTAYLVYNKNFSFKNLKVIVNFNLLLYSILVALTLLFLQYGINDFFDKKNISYGLDDYYFYTHSAQNFKLHKIEGINIPIFFDKTNLSQYRLPYHYFDLWINSLLQFFNFTSQIHTYLFVFVPMMLTITFFCFISLLFQLNFKNELLIFLLALAALFFIGFIPCKNIYFGQNLLQQPRIYCAYIFTILFYCEYIKNNIANAFSWLILMPICSILAAPPILSFVFIAGIFLFYKKNQHWKYLIFLSCFLLKVSE